MGGAGDWRSFTTVMSNFITTTSSSFCHHPHLGSKLVAAVQPRVEGIIQRDFHPERAEPGWQGGNQQRSCGSGSGSRPKAGDLVRQHQHEPPLEAGHHRCRALGPLQALLQTRPHPRAVPQERGGRPRHPGHPPPHLGQRRLPDGSLPGGWSSPPTSLLPDLCAATVSLCRGTGGATKGGVSSGSRDLL